MSARRPQIFRKKTKTQLRNDEQRLSKLKNLGRVMESVLNEVGIESIDQFKKMGWEKAMDRLVVVHPRYNQWIYAKVLMGALKGKIWYKLSKKELEESQKYFKA